MTDEFAEIVLAQLRAILVEMQDCKAQAREIVIAMQRQTQEINEMMRRLSSAHRDTSISRE